MTDDELRANLRRGMDVDAWLAETEARLDNGRRQIYTVPAVTDVRSCAICGRPSANRTRCSTCRHQLAVGVCAECGKEKPLGRNRVCGWCRQKATKAAKATVAA